MHFMLQKDTEEKFQVTGWLGSYFFFLDSVLKNVIIKAPEKPFM